LAENINSKTEEPHPAKLYRAIRNQIRPSTSSIKFSIGLAVAISPWRSQTSCTSRCALTSRLLSSRNSVSMSAGVTLSASLSALRCKRAI
jgi:hypothetical protein